MVVHNLSLPFIIILNFNLIIRQLFIDFDQVGVGYRVFARFVLLFLNWFCVLLVLHQTLFLQLISITIEFLGLGSFNLKLNIQVQILLVVHLIFVNKLLLLIIRFVAGSGIIFWICFKLAQTVLVIVLFFAWILILLIHLFVLV